ncbi:MAG: DUF4097 family beta strand repeat-containing protein [Tissierellaceae bacterium]|nr:DUF4097 family beta strand repeat-containing protein [Tissierellaceae bacterium]
MDIKKFVFILTGVVLIAFGVGIYSLRYNDNLGPISFNRSNELNVRSNGSNVRIGLDGIDVKDGDDHVQIGWDGINVKDGEDEVRVGWDGIKVKDDENISFNLFDFSTWFGISNRDLKTVDIDEQKNIELNGIDNIDITSSFIDIKQISEEREDILIHYHGRIRSNVIPTLEVQENDNTLNIELKNTKNSYSVTESNVVLEIFLPKDFNGSINTTSSSADIYMKNIIGDKFNITASSGDIKLEDLESENINIVTSSGNIYMDNILGDIFEIIASSGDITLNKLKGNKINVETSSGDVELQLPSDSNYTINGSSSSGRYTPSKNMKILINDRGDFKATTGNGENAIDITTSSGDVRFR